MPYFHIVFTMPPVVAEIARQNPRAVYDILFRAAAETLQLVAKTPKHLGAEIGLLSVLHTWGQNLHYHPHIHCVVPGGGLSPDGNRWVASRTKFFLQVKVLSRLYRGNFLAQLGRAHREGRLSFHGPLANLQAEAMFRQYLADARKIDWVVYSKPPFGGPEQVLAYVGRYTHRVAISNDRLIRVKDGQVTFKWKDYRQGNQNFNFRKLALGRTGISLVALALPLSTNPSPVSRLRSSTIGGGLLSSRGWARGSILRMA